MAYDYGELVTIGEGFTPGALLDWSRRLVAAARQDLDRLAARGMGAGLLEGIQVAQDELKTLNAKAERAGRASPPSSGTRSALLEAARDWREELRSLAKAVFDSEPEVQAEFRIGVRTSRSLPKLRDEIGHLLGAAEKHRAALATVGAGDAVLKRGGELCQKLDEACRDLEGELGRGPDPRPALSHAAGVLYTRARFVLRLARVEFRREPRRLAAYGGPGRR